MEGVMQDISPAGGMTAGRVYYLELYASLAEASEGATTIGFYITDVGGTGLHWYNHPTYITSKTAWTKVSTCITATGSEHWVHVRNTSGVTPTFVGSTAGYVYSGAFYTNFAYYYVDDVSVRPLADAGHDNDVCSTATIGKPCSFISGATYAWTAGDAFTAANSTISSPSTVTTGVTTTVNGTYMYILTVTLGGCTDTDTVIVTNQSITVIATATPSTINMGSTSSLSAVATPSTGVTYSWSPGGMTGTPVTVSPVATTIYTVTATNAIGCIATDTAVVNVVYPQCNITINYTVTAGGQNSSAVFGGPPTTTISNANIEVLGNLTIDHTNITFSNCNFKMAPNTQIIVPVNRTLTVNSKTHLYACGNMWDGIYIAQGGVFNANGSAFIEDALNGVVSQNGGTFTLNTAIFNRNRASVTVQAYSPGAHTGTIRNCIFSCRYIPSFASPASNYSVATLQGLITPLTSFPIAKMKAPHAIELSVYGVIATGVAGIQIGLDASGNYNIFDALKCGINLNTTSATIYNNYFQNMINPYSCTLGCYSSLGGYGVKALGSVSAAYTVTIGGTANIYQKNTFSNCYRGAYLEYYKTNTVKKNTFYNSSTGSGIAPYLGETGLFIKPANASTVTVNENTYTNCEDAITVNRTLSGTASAHNLQVNTNILSANASSKCTYGIHILDASSAPPLGSPSEIKDNTITEANYGINLSSCKQTITVGTNSITARYASTGTQAGIRASQCDKTIITNNHTKYNVATAGLSGGNLNSYGIYVISSTNMTVKCNTMEDAGRCLAFQGGCISLTPTYGITQNTMRRAREGFTLLSSGVIGTQGNATTPSGNIWDLTTGNYFTDGHTMMNGSNATLSTLYVVNATTGLATRPTANLQLIGTAYLWSTSLLNTTGSLSSCGYVPAYVLEDEYSYSTKDYSADTNNVNYLEDLANDTLNLSVYTDEVNWQLDQFTYGEIANDSLLLGSADLQNFYTNQNSQPIGQFASVNSYMTDSNYTSADSVNTIVTPSNTIEQNLQTCNTLMLKLLIDSNYVYTSAEVDTLYYIAEQCPIEGGPAVSVSRNLLMLILDDVIEFDDNCNEEARIAEEEGEEEEEKPAMLVHDNRFIIYPNPNNGNMVLNYDLKHNETGTIAIFDPTGRLTAGFNLSNDQKQLTIGRNDLGNGLYTIQVRVNGKLVHTDKVIIIK